MLFHEKGSLGLILVEFVEKAVGSSLQRADIEAYLAARGNNLFSFEVSTFKLGWGCIKILDCELDALSAGMVSTAGVNWLPFRVSSNDTSSPASIEKLMRKAAIAKKYEIT